MGSRLARSALRARGWRLAGGAPDLGKYVIVFAPHTCNWDLLLGLLAARGYGIRPSWLGKASIFRWPVAGFLRRLGGLPVHRDRHEGLVGQVVAAFTGTESMVLGLTPEGTRECTPYWRSGFYQIARAAGVPIVPASMDRRRRVITLGSALVPTGDTGRDMDRLRAFYAGAEGIHPEKASAVRLREEEGPRAGEPPLPGPGGPTGS